jgi:hypothetical protein
MEKIQIGVFSRKTAFERQKSATNFRVKQTSCCVIAEPSSNNLMVKNFQDWLICLENIASFLYPPNAKI